MKVAFHTLGCKVNSYESQAMLNMFEEAGYEEVDFKEVADVYVVNTCTVTNTGDSKSRQMIRKAIRKNPQATVCVVGCYSQVAPQDIEAIEGVSIILGTQFRNEIVDLVEKYQQTYERIVKVSEVKQLRKFEDLNIDRFLHTRAYLKIQDGCNNFCSYCIIPYLRGRVRSRSLEDIKDEVTSLVKNGVREVVLVGIEIASYGKDLDENIGLVDVVETISKIDGLNRVRLGSLEPRILTDDNITRLSKIDKLCPHFHISVQSIDNGVLSRMNRHYTREFLFDRVSMLKKYFLHPAITCDIIVGFPGETDEEFSNTIDGVKKIEFYELHVFKYSKRKWTRAAKMENQVDGNISAKRSEELISIGNELKDKYMNEYLGKTLDVLFESYDNGYLYGYTPNYIKVKVKGDESLWGKQVPVTLYSKEEELMLGSI